MMPENVVGVILAGGRSRRFGTPKSFAEKDNKPFFRWSLDAIAPVVDDIILITNQDLKGKFPTDLKVEIVTDMETFAGKGPLAGIYTAMLEKKACWYVIIPTDVPFMKAEVFKRLLAERKKVQAVIPVVNERLQPLIGLYHHTLKQEIETLLETDRLHMRALLDKANVKFVPFTEEKPFININRLEDFDSHIRYRD
ncbi:molybdenum cofactor guanylyltransferase [Oceanobacillus alkalisoli]|uniref:molybdenum cofactor guanylyltransferase n=1 Tax=Oceanobacillus alkalisoli TaxID=2925113 RepID=UPI001EE40D38|nr:molybdenum cofactor guanylyltransferase [Oceanobacillus alkalisoli]MCG5104374.1 molybdenum cofactor guanylyltransferase [Oceanobacillus alkalisoli]